MFGIPLFVVGLCVLLFYVFVLLPYLAKKGIVQSEIAAKWSTCVLVVLWVAGTIFDFIR